MPTLIFSIFFRRIFTKDNNSFKMTRRPSIQSNDLQNSFSKSIEQQNSILQEGPTTKSIKKSTRGRPNYPKKTNTLIEDNCITKNEEGCRQSDKQKISEYLHVSKIDQLRYRIASAQKTKLDQNKKLLKTVSIPLSLEKKSPMIRIHHQGLVKNCQKLQLQYRHFFNQMTRVKSVQKNIDVKKALTVYSSANKSKATQVSKKQTKVSNLNLQQNKRSHSEPHKIVKQQLTEENQFIPTRKVSKIDISYKNDFKNKGFQSRIKLKMIKFQPFGLNERKNALNRDNFQQLQIDNGQRKVFEDLQNEYKSKCMSFSNNSNEHGLNLQLTQLHSKIKNSPSITPKQNLALFKNKLQGKGNHRLVL